MQKRHWDTSSSLGYQKIQELECLQSHSSLDPSNLNISGESKKNLSHHAGMTSDMLPTLSMGLGMCSEDGVGIEVREGWEDWSIVYLSFKFLKWYVI